MRHTVGFDMGVKAADNITDSEKAIKLLNRSSRKNLLKMSYLCLI